MLGDGHPPVIGNPYNGHINLHYWVDDHPLLYGNDGSLEPSTYGTYKNGPLEVDLKMQVPKKVLCGGCGVCWTK